MFYLFIKKQQPELRIVRANSIPMASNVRSNDAVKIFNRRRDARGQSEKIVSLASQNNTNRSGPLRIYDAVNDFKEVVRCYACKESVTTPPEEVRRRPSDELSQKKGKYSATLLEGH